MKVGICDWGIGGLGIYKLLKTQTNWDLCYFSDAGFTPYGKVSPEQLFKRWQQIELFFETQEVDVIIVGCNALGTIVPAADKTFNILTQGINHIDISKNKCLGVTGGYRTIESQLFQNKGNARGIEVTTSVGQLLSAHIESGDTFSNKFITDVKTVFTPFKTESEVILACTHYPSIIEEINFFFPNLILIDPAVALSKLMFSKFNSEIGNQKSEFYTTGNSFDFVKLGNKAFKVKLTYCNSLILGDLTPTNHN
ncbi:MAG: glutamate racemase [Flavobacteriales bacterium]